MQSCHHRILENAGDILEITWSLKERQCPGAQVLAWRG